MKAKAILYCSQTGFTAKYAALLGEKLSLPVYSLKEGRKSLSRGTEVIFLGWLMGGLVRGLQTAQKRYSVNALLAVGMGEAGSQLENVRKMNRLSREIPLFTLRGGYREEALPFLYRLMMKLAKKTLIKELEEKGSVTEEEQITLSLLRYGGDRVEEKELLPIVSVLGK